MDFVVSREKAWGAFWRAIAYGPEREVVFSKSEDRDCFMLNGDPWAADRWADDGGRAWPYPANQCAPGTAHAPMIGIDTEA